MKFKFMIAGMAKQGVVSLDNKKTLGLCEQGEDSSYKIAAI